MFKSRKEKDKFIVKFNKILLYLGSLTGTIQY